MVTKANKSPKKTRKQRVKHITKTDTHFMVRRSLLVYAILVFVLFWLTAMSVYLVDRMVVEYTNTARYNQIHNTYSSLDGLDAGQRTWINEHTVYTHGYGVVTAHGNTVASGGYPSFWEGGIPSSGDLGEYEPRIYFGRSRRRRKRPHCR